MKTQTCEKRQLIKPVATTATPALVRAARKQCHQHHQVRQREQPLIRLNTGCFCCTRDKPEVAALREVVQVIHTNPRKIGHFVIGEDFLTRLNGNHDFGPLFFSALLSHPLDA